MRIEAIILGIALFMAGYYAGYSIGFRRCFEYLKDELDKFRSGKNDNM